MGALELSALTGASVLVVDDDGTNLSVMSDIFGVFGCAVRTAPSGGAALEHAQADPPDLILLDIGLPDLDGYSVCERLKADPRTADVPVIFMSGRHGTLDLVRAFAVGAVDYLTKPFAAEEALARARVHLSVRQLQRKLHQSVGRLEHEVAERRQAEQDLRRRVDALEALNLIAQRLTSWTDVAQGVAGVGPILQALFTAGSITVWVHEPGDAMLRHLATIGGAGEQPGSGAAAPVGSVVLEGPLVRIERLRAGNPLVAGNRPVPMVAGLFHTIVVTLCTHGEPVGMLCISAARPDQRYGAEDVVLAQTVGGLLSSAVENARLFELAQSRGAERERRRLARELHDSVSQALYAANRAAEALPFIWELDPDEGRERLEELRHFTHSALAEMRTMLVELRPRALVEAPLHESLALLAEVLTARDGIVVRTELCTMPLLAPDVQLTLYRIAQEALTNVSKHARASEVRLRLAVSPAPSAERPWQGAVTLAVADDGRGFEPGQVAAGHMGLLLMRERANDIGAELQVASAPGAGSSVVVVWSGAAKWDVGGHRTRRRAAGE